MTDLNYPFVDPDDPSVPQDFKLSPSQIGTFKRCPRKWAYDKIDEVPRVETKAQKVGTLTHLYLEEYLIHGHIPAIGLLDGNEEAEAPEEWHKEAVRYATATLHQIPTPGTAIVEGRFEVGMPGIGILRGLIDFRVPDQGAVLPEDLGVVMGEHPHGNVEDVPLIGDHKTTSSPRYIKNPEELADADPQGVIYPAVEFHRTGADFVDSFWSYVDKRKVRAYASKGRINRKRNHRAMLKILDICADMRDVKENNEKAETVRCNTAACRDFGGCDYLNICDRGGPKAKEEARKQAMANFAAANAALQKNQPAPVGVTKTEKITMSLLAELNGAKAQPAKQPASGLLAELQGAAKKPTVAPAAIETPKPEPVEPKPEPVEVKTGAEGLAAREAQPEPKPKKRRSRKKAEPQPEPEVKVVKVPLKATPTDAKGILAACAKDLIDVGAFDKVGPVLALID